MAGLHHYDSLQATMGCRMCLVTPRERVDLNLIVGSLLECLAAAIFSAVSIAGSRCAGGWHTGLPPPRPLSLAVWLTLPSGSQMALSAEWAAATMASQYTCTTHSAVVATLKAVYVRQCVTQTYAGKRKAAFSL